MKIAVRGNTKRLEEWRSRISSDHSITEFEDINSSVDLNDYDAVFDLNFENHLDDWEHYTEIKSPVFLSAVTVNLLEYYPNTAVYGINALPTMIGRELLEICSPTGENADITSLCKSLGWTDAEWVECRVGMVTPRIICMIINEAFYTVQEGTANEEDIDKGMKLGTAYPKGPFQWCSEMGIKNVYAVLEAMWNDTKEERYKICPRLKSAYLRG
jgi:3-hydroxybutyryl-CoA dehydrogenase